MELNQRLDQELTAEQKIKFQKDNGRFKYNKSKSFGI